MPKQQRTKPKSKPDPLSGLPPLNLNAAGIDIGSKEHYGAVPPDRDAQPVKTFKSFTCELHRLADWLQAWGIDTVAMESTGVFWIPLYQVLEPRGFRVYLVNARHIKNVPGRKTDVLDCANGHLRSRPGHDTLKNREEFRLLVRIVSRQPHHWRQGNQTRHSPRAQSHRTCTAHGRLHSAQQRECPGCKFPSACRSPLYAESHHSHGAQAGPSYLPHAQIRTTIR